MSTPLDADAFAALAHRCSGLNAEALLAAVLAHELPGRVAVTSSFGAEAAVLLHMVTEIAPATPIITLDTGYLFAETRAYAEKLAERLGIKDLRIVSPDPADLAARDPDGTLHRTDADACCRLRKVLPLERALAEFAGWITGRKRFHGDTRADLPLLEWDGVRLKANPLAHWDGARLDAERIRRGLPPHPLVAEGYPSIGCRPCTIRGAADRPARAGRWAGTAKTECGIHHRPATVALHS